MVHSICVSLKSPMLYLSLKFMTMFNNHNTTTNNNNNNIFSLSFPNAAVEVNILFKTINEEIDERQIAIKHKYIQNNRNVLSRCWVKSSLIIFLYSSRQWVYRYRSTVWREVTVCMTYCNILWILQSVWLSGVWVYNELKGQLLCIDSTRCAFTG